MMEAAGRAMDAPTHHASWCRHRRAPARIRHESVARGERRRRSARIASNSLDIARRRCAGPTVGAAEQQASRCLRDPRSNESLQQTGVVGAWW